MDDDDISYRIPQMIETLNRCACIAGYCALTIAGAFIVWRMSH